MDITVPQLAEGTDSGTIVSILVKEGEIVSTEQTVVEIETAKAIGNVPAPNGGQIGKIFVKVGDEVRVGQKILSVVSSGEEAPALAAPPTPTKVELPREEIVEPLKTNRATVTHYESKSGFPPPASPSIRKMAQELGIDLTHVKGSQRGGRIILEDVKKYLQTIQALAFQPKPEGKEAPKKKMASEPVDFSKWGPVRKVRASSLRKLIGQKMHESWERTPHVTQFDEVDATRVMDIRKKHKDSFAKSGASLTLTTFILKALSQTLVKHPLFNASWENGQDDIVYKDYIHIGVAVDTKDGLIVPVLRDVDKKDLLPLSKDLDRLAKQTRDRTIAPSELVGGTFTISNQGGIGSGHFTPIINRPESAILGVGKGALQARVVGKKVAPRLVVPLTLSYDHRLIDGAGAARFMVDLVKSIEEFDEKALGKKNLRRKK